MPSSWTIKTTTERFLCACTTRHILKSSATSRGSQRLTETPREIREIENCQPSIPEMEARFQPPKLHLVSTCGCSNPEFLSEIETSRLEKYMGPKSIWNSVPKLEGNHTPSSCRW